MLSLLSEVQRHVCQIEKEPTVSLELLLPLQFSPNVLKTSFPNLTDTFSLPLFYGGKSFFHTPPHVTTTNTAATAAATTIFLTNKSREEEGGEEEEEECVRLSKEEEERMLGSLLQEISEQRKMDSCRLNKLAKPFFPRQQQQQQQQIISIEGQPTTTTHFVLNSHQKLPRRFLKKMRKGLLLQLQIEKGGGRRTVNLATNSTAVNDCSARHTTTTTTTNTNNKQPTLTNKRKLSQPWCSSPITSVMTHQSFIVPSEQQKRQRKARN